MPVIAAEAIALADVLLIPAVADYCWKTQPGSIIK